MITIAPAPALDIVLNFKPGSSASPAFDPDGSKLTDIMQAAAAVREDVIEDPHTLTINYYWDNINALGVAKTLDTSGGRVTKARIRFEIEDDGVPTPWFFDPTPLANEEFAVSQTLFEDLPTFNQGE